MAIDQAFACHAQGEGRGRGTAAVAATAAKQESFLCVCWKTCWLNEKKDATTRRRNQEKKALLWLPPPPPQTGNSLLVEAHKRQFNSLPHSLRAF